MAIACRPTRDGLFWMRFVHCLSHNARALWVIKGMGSEVDVKGGVLKMV
jgi:hypothetical protein